MSSHGGVISVAPAAALLWQNEWKGIGILQPVLTPEGDLLISVIDEMAAPIGTREAAVAVEGGGVAAGREPRSRP